jgi:hypothetical protein
MRPSVVSPPTDTVTDSFRISFIDVPAASRVLAVAARTRLRGWFSPTAPACGIRHRVRSRPLFRHGCGLIGPLDVGAAAGDGGAEGQQCRRDLLDEGPFPPPVLV